MKNKRVLLGSLAIFVITVTGKQVTGIQKPVHLYFIEIADKITVITQLNLYV